MHRLFTRAAPCRTVEGVKWEREAYLDHMCFGGTERELFVELFGPLIGLDAEWKAQGAQERELNLTAFDFDWAESVFCGADNDACSGIEPVLLEETDAHTLRRDKYGRTTKLMKGYATLPLPLDHPVAEPEDWEPIKRWFTFSDKRVDADALANAKARRDAGAVVVASIPGGFDLPRQLMGEEIACICFLEEPELIEDILATVRDTALATFERVLEVVPIDLLHIHEDFAGRSGPLIGPDLVRRFLKPYFQPIWELCRSHGARICSLDTDGNVNAVMEALLDCGVNQVYPMEPAAGMDVVALRQQYGQRLIMKGGIDKHVLRRGQADIRAELEYKLQPMMHGGGMAFGLDHRIPNGTPLDNYRYYVAAARELLGLPPADFENGSWARMAW